MLVLKRKSGETVTVGEGRTAVVVEVIEVGPGWVRLGFDGPRDVPVTRGELLAGETTQENRK